jgi:hypothetical protein
VNGVNWQTLLMKAPIQRRNGTRRRTDMNPLRISKILVRECQGEKSNKKPMVGTITRKTKGNAKERPKDK